MSKHTDKRTASAAAALGRPVHIAAAFAGGISAMSNNNGGGLVGSVISGVADSRAKKKAVGKDTKALALPQNFIVAVTDDAVVLLVQTFMGKAKPTVLYSLPRGSFTATAQKDSTFHKLVLHPTPDTALLMRCGVRFAGKGNQAVVDAVLAAAGQPVTQNPDDQLISPMPSGYAPGSATSAPAGPWAAPAAVAAPVPAGDAPRGPEHLDGEAFEALLADLGFDDYVDAVVDLAVPAARLVPGAGATKERGTSRQGGWPDLAGADAWPLAEDGEPLAFALQVDLGAVSDLGVASGLPEDGLLSVFVDARGGAPVLVHTGAGTALKRLRAPGIKDGVVAPSLPQGGSYPAFALDPVLTMSLPATLAEDIGVEDEDVHALLDAVEGTFPLHRVGGHPRELAGSVSAQAAAEAPGRRKADDFVFGLQLDSDPAAGLAHDGEGIAYVLADARKGGLRTVVQAA